jgi:hypothetical protein
MLNHCHRYSEERRGFLLAGHMLVSVIYNHRLVIKLESYLEFLKKGMLWTQVFIQS